MPYNPALVAPMREEMTRMGARELTTMAEVDAALGDQKGSMLVFVNSVCGCAAGNARPALRLALQHGVKPQQVVTVFAGQDLDATARARQYFAEYQPSSPSIALIRDGEVVHFVHRHQIEGRSPAGRSRRTSRRRSTGISGRLSAVTSRLSSRAPGAARHHGRAGDERPRDLRRALRHQDERGVRMLDVGIHDATTGRRRRSSSGAA